MLNLPKSISKIVVTASIKNSSIPVTFPTAFITLPKVSVSITSPPIDLKRTSKASLLISGYKFLFPSSILEPLVSISNSIYSIVLLYVLKMYKVGPTKSITLFPTSFKSALFLESKSGEEFNTSSSKFAYVSSSFLAK